MLHIAVALFYSYQSVRSVYEKISIEKLILLVFCSLFVSIVLIGYGLSAVFLPTEPAYFTLLMALAGGALYIRNKDRKFTVEYSRARIAIAFIIIGATFLLYMWPALPDFGEPCHGGDCFTHMTTINYIFDEKDMGMRTEYAFRTMKNYPLGMHINAAVLSAFMGVHPFLLTYPMLAFAAALAAFACYCAAREGTKGAAALAPLLFIAASAYPISALAAFGFWSHMIGILLILAAAVIALDYRKTPTPELLLAQISCVIALLFTYNIWMPVAAAVFLAAWHYSGKRSLRHAALFAAAWGAAFLFQLPGILSNSSIAAADGNVMHYDTGISMVFLPILAMAGARAAFVRPETRLFAVFVGFAALQTIFFLTGMAFFGMAQYWFFKNFYLLLYPLSVLAGIGLMELLQNRMRPPAALLTLAVVALLLIAFNDRMLAAVSGHEQREWLSPMDDSFQYGRMAGLPKIMNISFFIRGLPLQDDVYYAGPMGDPCWVYSITRHRIFYEGIPSTEFVPQQRVLYTDGKFAVYRGPITNATPTKCYGWVLESIRR